MCGCVVGGCWSLCVGVLMQVVFSFSMCLSVCGCVDGGCWSLCVGEFMQAVGLGVFTCCRLVFVYVSVDGGF